MENDEPSILAFLCNWCSYAGADLAGTSRLKYSPNIRIIRLMCSGRIDPTFVLKAFRDGVDGVLMCGCHPGDCHYHSGNFKCLRRYHMLQDYLRQMGIDKERLRLAWISASEGKQFAELADDLRISIKELGPLRIRESLHIPKKNKQ